MDITVETPTKARIENIQDDELKKLRSFLTYTNKSVQFQIKKHKENYWFKKKNPEAWEARLKQLESELKTCLIFNDNGNNYIRPGIIPYLNKLNINIKNQIQYPESSPIPWKKQPEFTPYDYQNESVKKLTEVKHGNISLPTGSGKSFILLMIARNMGLPTVVVTPSKSIFNELLSEFQERLGKAYVGGYGDGKKDINKKITIAVGKSLTQLQPGTDGYDFFKKKQLMLVDESHTFAAEELNNACHGVLSEVPYRMFVSATQTRNDGTERLLQSVIGRNVLKLTLQEAIDNNYLCPLKFKVINTYSKDTRDIKDPMKCKRTHFLYNENIAKISAQIANSNYKTRGESTLILVEELKQIQMLTSLLDVPYSYVHSASKAKAAEWGLQKVKLQEEVDKFNNGDVKVLIGTKAISTGTNLYPTHHTINWVGGGSEIVTKQGAMGRSTRVLEKSKFKDLHKPKNAATIYDFNVKSIPILNKQLNKRIAYYRESGSDVIFY